MRNSKAKKIKAKVYGDMATVGTRYRRLDNGQIIRIDGGLRNAYQTAKGRRK